MKSSAYCLLFMLFGCSTASWSAAPLFNDDMFTENDAVLVTNQHGQAVYQWQAEQPLIPASLTKLVTTYLAIDKWGLDHHFGTDFYLHEDQLWVKGYGDPFLISEELDVLAGHLRQAIQGRPLKSIWLDGGFFDIDGVPGRSAAADPYNAPLSAIAANFNTAKLKKTRGKIVSAEVQTPLTPTALAVAGNIGHSAERVNLQNEANAQRYFAELLISKLGLKDLQINSDATLPANATLIYQHLNSRSLADSLRGALAFSHNFIANQLYLKLAESEKSVAVDFEKANAYVRQRLEQQLGWIDTSLEEGSGLSRKNRLTAKQIEQVLSALEPHKNLLKPVKTRFKDAVVYAKTGTLEGVRSYAGYIELPHGSYRFVYMFNRAVPYAYRDQMLHELIVRLQSAA